MAKARILIEGMIQGVGYRALIKQAARSLKLKGLARNLPDETVEIFIEGPKQNIQKFLKRIHIKGKPEDILSINVTETKCFWEGEPHYQPAWKPYKGFQIDYGIEKLDPFQESTLEDHEYGKLYFSNMRGEMKGSRSELKGFKENTSKDFQTLQGEMKGFRGELKEFREDTNTNFQQMAEKYGDISQELKRFRETIERFLDRFLKERSKK